MKYVAWLMLLVGSAVQAQDATDCMQVENARDRLACFDRLFPASDRPTPKLPTRTDETPVLEREIPAEPAHTQSLPLPGVEQAGAEQDTPPVSKPLTKGDMFGKSPQVNLTTTIKAVQKQDQKKMVFLLANDEVWMQDSPRSLSIRKGDTVTIKNAITGGYMLRTEGGASTRVRRIK